MTEPITKEDLGLLPERARGVHKLWQAFNTLDAECLIHPQGHVADGVLYLVTELIASQKRVKAAHILELVLRDQVAAYEKRAAELLNHIRGLDCEGEITKRAEESLRRDRP